jgi:DnaJ-class molecular chaperone
MSIPLTVCKACDGLGYHDIYQNEYDITEETCELCGGEGEIEND